LATSAPDALRRISDRTDLSRRSSVAGWRANRWGPRLPQFWFRPCRRRKRARCFV
jgi:hypothetical protein